MTSQPRTMVFIDGFNLYNGLREGHNRRFLWLDVDELSRQILRDNAQDLRSVYYFTAGVRGDEHAARRQSTYLRALRIHCHFTEQFIARFAKRDRDCWSCGAAIQRWEEKETDVSLSVNVVKAAALDLFDHAVIVSGDSDLKPAIEIGREMKPGATFTVAFPPKRHSNALHDEADRVVRINESILGRSLLPEVVRDARKVYSRPPTWR